MLPGPGRIAVLADVEGFGAELQLVAFPEIVFFSIAKFNWGAAGLLIFPEKRGGRYVAVEFAWEGGVAGRVVVEPVLVLPLGLAGRGSVHCV